MERHNGRNWQAIRLSLCLALALPGACSRPSRDQGDTPPHPSRTAADARPSSGAIQPPSSGRAAEQRLKVVVLGDSLTAGLGLASNEAYPALLQGKIDSAGLPFEIVNAGVSGDTSAGGRRRLEWSLQNGARVLVVALGANDGLRGLPVEDMRRNLAQIIEIAQARRVNVILAGMEAPPNYGSEYAAAFRQVYSDLAAQYKVRLVPFLLDRVAGEASLNQADGIHPNVRGAEIVADTVWTALRPELARLSNS